MMRSIWASAPVCAPKKAAGQMVIDDAACLHRRVYRNGSGEPESVPPELSRQGLRGRGPRRNVIQCLRGDVLVRSSVLAGRIAPDGRSKPFGQVERGSGIVDGCLDLRAVAYDPGIGQEPRDVVGGEFGHG